MSASRIGVSANAVATSSHAPPRIAAALLIAVVATLASACGSPEGLTLSGRASCGIGPAGGRMFPAAAVGDIKALPASGDGSADYLRSLIRRGAWAKGMRDETDWRILSRVAGSVIYVHLDDSGSIDYRADVGRGADTWKLEDEGVCEPRATYENADPAILHAGQQPVDEVSTNLRLSAEPLGCGDESTLMTLVEEGDDHVIVTAGFKPTDKICPRIDLLTRRVPFVVRLSRPLGDRSVLDGALVPPRPVSR